MEAWQLLVHVCRRWRNLVLGSPRRLNLQLYCSPKTPTKDTLDIWPALPLIVGGNMAPALGTDNVIAALGQNNRLCELFLWNLAGSQLAEVLAAMQVPFLELTEIRFSSDGKTPPVIPDSFLGGSAPRLRYFSLYRIPFPGLPKLLCSATHLVFLNLYDIPHSGYISSQAMVALISVLSNLEELTLQFQSPQSRHDWQRRSLPPPKHSILPALRMLNYKGVTEYLEELVTGIDTPQLNFLHITFFNQIDFVCPRLAQFINCTPTLRTRDEACVLFDNSTATITLHYRTANLDFDDLRIKVSCRESDWQVSSIEQVCNSFLHTLSTVDALHIERGYISLELVWKSDGIDNTLWLQLLLPFTAVKNLDRKSVV